MCASSGLTVTSRMVMMNTTTTTRPHHTTHGTFWSVITAMVRAVVIRIIRKLHTPLAVNLVGFPDGAARICKTCYRRHAGCSGVMVSVARGLRVWIRFVHKRLIGVRGVGLVNGTSHLCFEDVCFGGCFSSANVSISIRIYKRGSAYGGPARDWFRTRRHDRGRL
jgi:hypothetical protein